MILGLRTDKESILPSQFLKTKPIKTDMNIGRSNKGVIPTLGFFFTVSSDLFGSSYTTGCRPDEDNAEEM